MKIKKVEMENILRFKKDVIEFNNDLNVIEGINHDDGGGSNGSGKSTLHQAIAWALFGDSTRGIKADDIITWGKDSCRAKVWFDNGAVIERGREKGRAENNFIKFTIGDREVPGRTITTLNDKIEKYLMVTRDVFLNSIFWGQDWDTILVDGTDKDRKDLLGVLVEFEKLDQVLKKIRSELKGIRENKISLQARYDVYKEKVEGGNLEEMVDLLDVKQDRFDLLNEEIKEVNELLLKVRGQSKLKDKYAEYLKLEEYYDSRKIKLDSIIVELKRCGKQWGEIEALWLESVGIENKLEGKVEELDKAVKYDTCPTCLRPVDGEYKDSLLQEKEKLGKELLVAKEESRLQRQRLDSNIEGQKSLTEEKHRLEPMQLKAEELRDMFKDYISALDDQNEEEISEKYKGMQEEILQLKGDVSGLKIKVNDYKKAELELEKIEEGLKELIRKVDIYESLEQIFGQKGLRVYLLDNLIKDLEFKTNSYLSQLTDRDISVVVQSGEDLKITITEDNFSCDWNSFSGGEKKRIAVALRLALWTHLLERGCKPRFGMFDEILGGLDEGGRLKVLNLLESLSEKYETQIFLISHFPVKDLAVDWNKIVIERRNGISNIRR